jgi:Kdo2-lipid IVA lauroyltransferase/acyltransferase
MAKVAYYIFVIPLSYLPLVILYAIMDIFYLLLISIVPYRKKVIIQNIERSFPNKTKSEKAKIKRQFYRHLTQLLAESVKGLSISENELKRRITVKNPEVMDDLYANGKNVLLVSGHYNNWEWVILSQALLFKHDAIGIGMPMTSKFWDKKINQRRSRFGMKVVHAKNYKEALTSDKERLKSVLVLSDQSPGDSLKSYWMQFLNQNTAVLFGAEMMAHQLNYAVVFYALRKIKRGKYEMELFLITDNPLERSWGEITEAHTHLLEQEINNEPAPWLWSHKRWKREFPSDLETLKQQQRTAFNEKYNL